MEKLTVGLGNRSYDICIGSGLNRGALIRQALPEVRDVMVVTNDTVGPLYLEGLAAELTAAGFAVRQVILRDGECYKTVESFMAIETALLEAGFGRDCALIALGGGVVGDLTGFAAASYQRGVRFVQVPTTLLAMVDSSVGGKTGFNHPLGKNMIGAFWQPQVVVADVASLKTLPGREISAGLGEVIKTAIIADAEFFADLERDCRNFPKISEESLVAMVRRCCTVKARIVAEDEREAGVRALLNLGHTFGHAVETFLGYGTWLHGEAVGLGLTMAATLAQKRGLLGADEVTRITKLSQLCGLPVAIPAKMTGNDFLRLMRHDKKVRQGVIRYVLPLRIGECRVFRDVADDEVRQLVDGLKSPQEN